jgi:hypothetical protein
VTFNIKISQHLNYEAMISKRYDVVFWQTAAFFWNGCRKLVMDLIVLSRVIIVETEKF